MISSPLNIKLKQLHQNHINNITILNIIELIQKLKEYDQQIVVQIPNFEILLYYFLQMKYFLTQVLDNHKISIVQTILKPLEQIIEILKMLLINTLKVIRHNQTHFVNSQQDFKEQGQDQDNNFNIQIHETMSQDQIVELQQLEFNTRLMEFLQINGQQENIDRLLFEEQSIINQKHFSNDFKQYYQSKCRRQFLQLISSQQTLLYHISQPITQDNPEVLFYVLSESLRRDQNKVLIKSNQSSKIDFESLFYSNTTDLQCFKFHTEAYDFDEINNNEGKKIQLILSFKEKVSQLLMIPVSDIEILDLLKGSVVILFTIKSKDNLSLNELQALEQVCGGKIEVFQYFACGYNQQQGNQIGLSSDDFSPEFNKFWGQNYADKVQRGPNYHKYDYYYPKGYNGYALNIQNKYGQDQKWLQKDGNDQEWRILYHGTKFQFLKSIVQTGLIPGSGQGYQTHQCYFTNQQVGKGVYFSNQMQICLGYTNATAIGSKKFVLIFQSRVNPRAIRVSKQMEQSGIFVVNQTQDIRPYRILLKEV